MIHISIICVLLAPIQPTVMLMLAAAFAIVSKPARVFMPPMRWPLVALWVAAAISMCLSEWPDMAFWGYWGRCEGLLTWTLIGAVAVSYTRTTDCTLPLILTCALWSLASIVLALSGGHTWVPSRIALGGAACVIVAITAVRAPILVLPAVVLVYLSDSRAAIVASVAGIVVAYAVHGLISRRTWRIAAVAVAAAAALACLSPQIRHKITSPQGEVGNGARTHWLKESLDIAACRPLFGYGLDTQSRLLTPAPLAYRQPGVTSDRAHNLVADVTLQVGLVGLSILLLMIVHAVTLTRRSAEYADGLEPDCYLYKLNINNRARLAGIAAWIVFGMMNPQGIPANMLFLTLILGMK